MNKIILTLSIVVFLMACSGNSKDNMVKTEKGTPYELIRNANGVKPKVSEYVEANIDVFSSNGELKFSSSQQGQPAIINIMPDNPNAPANPIVDVIKSLGVKDSAKLVATPEMMNNQNGTDTIIYHIGIKKIYTEEEFKIFQQNINNKSTERFNRITEKVNGLYSKLSSDEMKSKMIKTPSGLQYIVLEEGSGAVTPAGSEVTVDYHGILKRSGEVFDSSFKRPMPFSFKLGAGQVIAGWDEGIGLLKGGSKALLIIPSNLAYGDRDTGIIKKGDDLIFYVELK